MGRGWEGGGKGVGRGWEGGGKGVAILSNPQLAHRSVTYNMRARVIAITDSIPIASLVFDTLRMADDRRGRTIVVGGRS